DAISRSSSATSAIVDGGRRRFAAGRTRRTLTVAPLALRTLNVPALPADAQQMRAEDFALAQGLRHTRVTLAGWNRHPWGVLRSWLFGSLAVVGGLLLAVWAIASITTPDPSGLGLPGLTRRATLGDV